MINTLIPKVNKVNKNVKKINFNFLFQIIRFK